MNKFKAILALIIVILFLGGILVVSAILNKVPENPAGTVGNSGGNLYNNGLFCEIEGQVFFTNPYDQNTLYVMNSDETEAEKLTTVGVKFINAAGKYVYYYQDSVGDGTGLGYAIKTTGICRIKRNGKKNECLIRVPLLSMSLIDNNIFYQYSNDDGSLSLNTISIDKSSQGTAMTGIINTASAVNGTVYYARQEEDYLLYAFDTKTGMNTLLWNHQVYNPVYHTDGYIYFIDVEDRYRLHRYNPVTGENQTLTSDQVDSFNVYENCIYYQHFSIDSPALKRMQTDGSIAEIVARGNYNNINLTSQYAYFMEYGSPYTVYHQSLWGPINPTMFIPQVED